MPPIDKEPFDQKVKRLQEQFDLTDFSLDVECIHQAGDLSDLVQNALTRLLPEVPVQIAETVSTDGRRYIATVSSHGLPVGELYADTHADFLPDDFLALFEALPEQLATVKRFYLINPKLTGQVAWYFCGLPANMQQAQTAGLPVVLPGDDWLYQEVGEY
ncbi:MAG: hypothetical protein J0H74_12075 [Chitinophagaceae bacterium]|nr:hypothetical protein [Chitinophagaceae bacterium]